MNAINETTPVIEKIDCDRQGRDIHIGIRRGSNTTWLPVMSEEELKDLGSMIDNFIKADKENLQQVEMIKAEIERLKNQNTTYLDKSYTKQTEWGMHGAYHVLMELEDFINNMPEEVPQDEQRNETDKHGVFSWLHPNGRPKLWLGDMGEI